MAARLEHRTQPAPLLGGRKAVSVGNRLSVRRATLPETTKEGDRFEQQEDGSLLFLETETLQKKQDVRAMLNSLWKDS